MGKNIIYVILLVITAAAVCIAGSYRSEAIPSDRTGRGRFVKSGSGCRYESEELGFGLTFDAGWVVYDGMQLEKIVRENRTDKDIENMYECPINKLAFAGGFASPDASLEITVATGNSIPSTEFSSAYMDSLVNDLRASVDTLGGKWKDGNAYIEPLNDGGRVLIYYYEYEFLGKSSSVFRAKANANGNIVSMNGKYTDENGLRTLRSFAQNLNVIEAA